MDELCWILGIGLVAIVIMTVVGHGLWLAAAAIGRAFAGRQRLRQREDSNLASTLLRLLMEGRLDRSTYEKVFRALNGWPPQSSQPPMGDGFPVISPQPATPPPLPVIPITREESAALVQPIEENPAYEASPTEVVSEAPPIDYPPEMEPEPTRPFAPAPFPSRKSAALIPRLPAASPPVVPVPVAPAPTPARPWTAVLASFMQEANIRWGELVGGLLIVGCSIALVRTFWSSIAGHTWLKFGVFTSITSGIFSVGLYTEHRWKLPTTSRAILLIASLLVPLSFMGVFIDGPARHDHIALLGAAAAIGIFGYFLLAAGRVLTPNAPFPLAVGILGSTVAQVIIALIPRHGPTALLLAAAIPLVFYLGSILWAVRPHVSTAQITYTAAAHLLILLGVTTCAAAITLPLLLETGPIAPMLRSLALLYPPAAIPSLLIGGLIYKRCPSSPNSSWRIAGAAIAILGLMLLLAGVVAAYPGINAPILCAVYAVVAAFLAYILSRPRAASAASLLLVIALLLWPNLSLRQHAADLLLLHAIFITLLACLARLTNRSARIFTTPFTQTGLLTAGVAGLVLLARLIIPDWSPIPITPLSCRLIGLSASLLLASIAQPQPAVYGIFQLTLTLTAAVSALAITKNYPFSFAGLRAQLLGIAALTPLWPSVRALLARFGLSPDHPARLISLDRFLPALLLAGLIGCSAIAIYPGLFAEFHISHPLSSSAPTPTLTWILAALVLIGIFTHARSTPPSLIDLAIILTLFCILPLSASTWNAAHAAASAWRWLSAVGLITTLAAFWPNLSRPHRPLSTLAITLTLGPILLLTIIAAQLQLTGHSLPGPATGLFAHLSASANYLPPMLVAVLVLLAHAARHRSPAAALAGSLTLNLTVALGYALHVTSGGRPFTTDNLIRLIQLNTIASALLALTWPLLLRRPTQTHWQCLTVAGVGIIPLVVMLIVGEVSLRANPAQPAKWLHSISGPMGAISILLAATAIVAIDFLTRRKVSLLAIILLLLAAGTWVALGATSDGWLALHLLLACRIAAPLLVFGVGWTLARSPSSAAHIPESPSARASAMLNLFDWPAVISQITLAIPCLGALIAILSFRLAIDDPARPTWSVLGIASTAGLLAALAVWTANARWLFASGILFNAAATLWIALFPSPAPPFNLLQINILALAVGGIASLGIDQFIIRPIAPALISSRWPRWHSIAAILATLAAAAIALLDLLGISPLIPTGLPGSTFAQIAPLAALTILAFLLLYDLFAIAAIPILYVIGLIWLARAGFILRPWWNLQLWHALLILGGYNVAAAFCYNIRATLIDLARHLAIPRRDGWPSPSPSWLTPVLLIQAGLLFGLAFIYVANNPAALPRQGAAIAAFCMSIAIGLLASEKNHSNLKIACLFSAVIAANLCAWAWIDPGTRSSTLDRMAATLLTLAAMSAAYRLLPSRLLSRPNDWITAASFCSPLLAIGLLFCLMAILLTEFGMFQTSGIAAMSAPAFIIVGFSILAVATLCALCALRPGFDPFAGSARQRGTYVYIAQVLFALVILHARFVHPAWFSHGIIARFWPLILLAIALTNAGASEWVRRTGQPELSAPFLNLAGLLPLLTVAGYFILHSHRGIIDLTSILLLTAAIYAALAFTRKSFAFAILAVLAANGALWETLSHNPAVAFLQHPQLWLIPPSLSVLAAAHFNRRRLSPWQLQTIRYVCLLVLYFSSTAEVWINRDDATPLLPLCLAVLAAAGVFAGIWLRIQSFLFLGTAFSFIAVASLIRLAARQVHGNWPWLVAGILLGSAIVVAFALFEKKRTQMLTLLENLRQWE